MHAGKDVSFSGNLGQGEGVRESAVPRAVAGLADVRVLSVAVGYWHTLALSEDGSIYSFGSGFNGRLGHGDTIAQHAPRRIDALHGVRVTAVAASESHSLVLSDAGAVYSFGDDNAGQLGHDEAREQHTPKLIEALREVKISALAAGREHSLAVSEAGETYSFGCGRASLGHGDDRWEERTPRLIEALRGVHVIAVAAGSEHSLALSEEGEVYSFGWNSHGQLGHGDLLWKPTPRLVEALRGVRISSVAAGGSHSLVLSEAGDAYSFGWNGQGQLGCGRIAMLLEPCRIESRSSARLSAIAAGSAHSLALGEQGHVYSFGWNMHFQLGHSSSKADTLSHRASVGRCGPCA